jgi:hypothetical protein
MTQVVATLGRKGDMCDERKTGNARNRKVRCYLGSATHTPLKTAGTFPAPDTERLCERGRSTGSMQLLVNSTVAITSGED